MRVIGFKPIPIERRKYKDVHFQFSIDPNYSNWKHVEKLHFVIIYKNYED